MNANGSNVLGRFEHCLLKKATLAFSDPQKKLLVENIYKNNEGFGIDDLPTVDTCFFDYHELEDEHVSSLWDYGLSGSDLEDRVDAGALQPFAALNLDGTIIGYGDDGFQELRNWGILCLDLEHAAGDDCPVVWVYRGALFPWADASASLQVEVTDQPNGDGDDDDV